MKFPEKRFMFTVKDISRACGISRTSLIRMEESGFLTPYHTDPESGYRYYDADNITQIGQYQMLQELGLTRSEISDFYYQRIDNAEFLREQRLKLNRLDRLLNRLEMQYDPSADYSFHFIEIPETVCYCETINGASIPELEAAAYNIYQHMIREGFQVNMTEHMFFISLPSDSTDPKKGTLFNRAMMCVPIIPDGKRAAGVKVFPPSYAFSTIVHGNYEVIPSMIENFHRELFRRHLKPTDAMRTIPLIAPCTGEHYDPDDYCYECLIPIEREY